MFRSGIVLAAAAALSLGACGGGGGSSSDSEKITKAIQSTAGITDASLCDTLFTAQGVQQTYSESSPEAGRKDCRDQVKAKHQVKPSDVSVTDIKVTGSTATATGAVKGRKGYFRLRKAGGDWQIDGVTDSSGSSSASAATTTPAVPTTPTTATTPPATASTPTAPAPKATTTPTSSALLEVEGSVLAWARAGRNGQKLAFCGLESPALLRRQTGLQGNAAVRACVRGFRPIASFPRPETIQFAGGTIHGNRATVAIRAPGKGNTTILALVRISGLWKIDNAH